MEVRDSSGLPPGGPRGVEKPLRRARRGRESLPESQEGLGGHPKGLGGIESLLRRAVRFGKPS